MSFRLRIVIFALGTLVLGALPATTAHADVPAPALAWPAVAAVPPNAVSGVCILQAVPLDIRTDLSGTALYAVEGLANSVGQVPTSTKIVCTVEPAGLRAVGTFVGAAAAASDSVVTSLAGQRVCVRAVGEFLIGPSPVDTGVRCSPSLGIG